MFYPKIKVIFLIKVKRMLYMDVLAHMILRHTLLKLEVYGYKKVYIISKNMWGNVKKLCFTPK